MTQRLVEEEAARKWAEEHAQEAQKKVNDETCKLRESLQDVHKEPIELLRHLHALIDRVIYDGSFASIQVLCSCCMSYIIKLVALTLILI